MLGSTCCKRNPNSRWNNEGIIGIIEWGNGWQLLSKQMDGQTVEENEQGSLRRYFWIVYSHGGRIYHLNPSTRLSIVLRFSQGRWQTFS